MELIALGLTVIARAEGETPKMVQKSEIFQNIKNPKKTSCEKVKMVRTKERKQKFVHFEKKHGRWPGLLYRTP